MPTADGVFPTDDELRSKIQSYGWESIQSAAMKDEQQKLKYYKEQVKKLFAEKLIPEVAEPELEETIFFGVIRSDQVRYFVTRTQGEMTFRLVQEELTPLIAATNKILRAIGGGARPHNIVDNKIIIYERSHNHGIFSGRLVESAVRETIKANPKDSLVILLMVAFAIVSAMSHLGFKVVGLSMQSLDKLTFSIVALSLVSIIGLTLTFLNIRRSRLISWNYFDEDVV